MGIISKRLHGWHLLLMFNEVLTATVLFWGMFSIWRMYAGLLEEHYPAYYYLVILTIVLDNLRQIQEPRFISATAMAGESAFTLRRTLYISLVWLGFLVSRHDMAVSRAFLFTYLGCLFPCFLLSHIVGRRHLAQRVFGNQQRFGVVLLGNPEGSEKLVQWLGTKENIGIFLLGYLDNRGPSGALGLARLGTVEDLSHVLESTNARLVVSLSLPADEDEAIRLRETCDLLGCRLSFQCRLGGDLVSRVSLCQTEGVTMLSIRSEPLQSPFNRMIKRSIDIIFALPMIVFVLPPLALIVWLIQRIYSPGPLLFKQQRSGLAWQPFTLLKFRTMHCHAGDEGRQAVHGDERIFKGGGFLRRSSLDEFPQFLNVLTGTMSVVGPRPHLGVHDIEFAKIRPEYRARAYIKPGITGLAQVQGFRGPTPQNHHINARVKADLYYLENWTWMSDIVLIYRTGLHLLKATNAV